MVSEQLRRPRKMVSSDSRSKPGKAKQRAQTVRRPGLTGAARLRRWCRDLYRFPSRVWLWRHQSGTYVKFTPAGAELIA